MSKVTNEPKRKRAPAVSRALRALGIVAADVAAKTPAYVRALAFLAYESAVSAGADVAAGLSPAPFYAPVAKQAGLPKSRVISLVAPVVFRENGARNPLPLPAKLRSDSVARAVRKRRDAGGTLGRWESVAAATSAALGRPVSETAVRALYAKAGGDLAASYTGRGTRIAAPKTRESETVEVDTTTEPTGA